MLEGIEDAVHHGHGLFGGDWPVLEHVLFEVHAFYVLHHDVVAVRGGVSEGRIEFHDGGVVHPEQKFHLFLDAAHDGAIARELGQNFFYHYLVPLGVHAAVNLPHAAAGNGLIVNFVYTDLLHEKL